MALSPVGMPALAQTATGGQSGTIEQEVRRPTAPLSDAAPFRIEKPSAAAGADTGQRFLVRDIVVDGAKSIAQERIRAVVAPYIGREVSLADLYRAADAVTSLYANEGYPLSFAVIPEQDVADGIVRLVVVEGTVDQVIVEVKGHGGLVGADRVKRAVERQFATLVRTGPVRTADLERALLLIRDWPGTRITSVLTPSKTTEGAADLLVEIDIDPFEGRLGADNRLRHDFGTYRGGLGLGLRSVMVPGDQLSLDARTSVKPRAFKQLYGRYDAPVGASGVRLFISGSAARTRAISGLLGDLNFAGEERVARIGGTYALMRSRARNLTVSIESALIDSRSGILDTTLIHDKLRTAEGRLTYDWSDSRGGQSLVEGGIIQGLPIFGASKKGSDFASRSVGTPVFTAVTARAFHERPLGGPISMSAEIDGQVMVAGSALAPVECAVGGERFGRAYLPGAIGGDHCLRVMAELKAQVDYAPVRLEPYLFADFGVIRQKGRLDFDEERSARAASAGVGLRAGLPFGLVAEGVAAVPLMKRYSESDRDVRFFFNLNLFF